MHFKQITTTGHNLKSVIYENNYSVCAWEIKVYSNFRHNLLAYKSTFSISIDSIYGISGGFLKCYKIKWFWNLIFKFEYLGMRC